MKTLKYTNANKALNVEYLVDLIGDNDMLAVYETSHIVGGTKILGIGTNGQLVGLPEHDDQIVNSDNTRTKLTLTNMVALAVSKNLSMAVHTPGVASPTIKNTLTELAFTSGAPDSPVAGLAQVETVTLPAFAAAAQGDYIILKNALSQKTIAVWLDKDANGTTPTGAAYVAADYKVKASIVTGNTAIQVATAVRAALLTATAWIAEVTVIAVGNGTMTVTQKYNGVVAEAVPHNTGDTGAGSITAASDTVGTVGTAYTFQLEVEGGNTPYIFTTESALPEGITLGLDGLFHGTAREVGTFSLTVTVTDLFGITSTWGEDLVPVAGGD